MNIQSFSTDGGGDDGFGGGHGLEDLQAGSAPDAQGHDNYGGAAQMLDDRGHTAGNFDRVAGPLLNAAVGIATDDAESRMRDFGFDRRPDLATKILDGIDVRFPVHGADEGDERRRRVRIG